jgi:hypothetical protein
MRRFGRSVVVVCCALPLVSALWLHAVEAMTGNKYRTISALGKISYVNGVMEARERRRHGARRQGTEAESSRRDRTALVSATTVNGLSRKSPRRPSRIR